LKEWSERHDLNLRRRGGESSLKRTFLRTPRRGLGSLERDYDNIRENGGGLDRVCQALPAGEANRSFGGYPVLDTQAFAFRPFRRVLSIARRVQAQTPGAKAAFENAMAGSLKDWARVMKRDVHALYLASRDPRVPWYAKALALVVAGYALSPIDLVPDFIPVLGYLDDVILVPLGVLLVIRLIPPEIMAEHRDSAAAAQERPASRGAAVAIAVTWVGSAILCGWLVYRFLDG
jgi:uncharacterized membrane protein YkvA (DUF1232 family)